MHVYVISCWLNICAFIFVRADVAMSVSVRVVGTFRMRFFVCNDILLECLFAFYFIYYLVNNSVLWQIDGLHKHYNDMNVVP